MSAFDARIRVGQMAVAPLQEREDGPIYEVELHLGILTLAPVGPQQAIPVPIGNLRAPMDMDAVDNLLAELQEVREKMSRRPNIQVANSLEGVDKAAQFQQGLR